jgi:hypothetical protein
VYCQNSIAIIAHFKRIPKYGRKTVAAGKPVLVPQIKCSHFCGYDMRRFEGKKSYWIETFA